MIRYQNGDDQNNEHIFNFSCLPTTNFLIEFRYPEFICIIFSLGGVVSEMVYSLMHTVFSWLLEEYKCVRGKVMGVYGRGGRLGGRDWGLGGVGWSRGGTASLKVPLSNYRTGGGGGTSFLSSIGKLKPPTPLF